MLSPFVLVVLLKGYGFTVDFYSIEACQKMQRKLEISVNAVNVKCGARGSPLPAFKVKANRPHFRQAPRRPKVTQQPTVWGWNTNDQRRERP
jgi:hypothetical protein